MKERVEGRLQKRPRQLCFAIVSKFFTYALIISPHSQSNAGVENLFNVNVTPVEDVLLFIGTPNSGSLALFIH